MDFYNIWKRLSIKPAAFNEAGIEPAERELIEKAEPFLEEALNIYYQKQE